METTSKLNPGQPFPAMTFARLDGSPYAFGGTGSWQALFVFRGQHCPICKSYLGQVEARLDKFSTLDVSVAAISADSEAQTRVMAEAAKPTFPLLYGLDEATMRTLGLYISAPRSAQETDHNFAEPALFVVNVDGLLQVVEVANAPFLRPDLDRLIGGLGFIIEKGYPVRGTVK
jgi:peroxiredoxin